MKWLKGVVTKTEPFSVRTTSPTVQVELENGRRVWATPHFKLSLCEHVLIAWDYTNSCIGMITTKKRLDQMETERDKVEASSMIDVSRNPSDEVFEENLSDLGESSNSSLTEKGEEDSMIEIEVFQNPTCEDVDRDSIVELRNDITR
jgi:hypothetical protein